MTNVIQHPNTTQALQNAHFMHPREMSDELTARLAAKMEALAYEAYLDGRRRGFAQGWLNGATIAAGLCLLSLALACAT